MDDLAMLALAERGGGACDAGNRIPTGRWPLYSEGQTRNIDAGESTAVLEFEAERDELFTDMSISVELDDGTTVGASVSVEYCNTKYLVDSRVRAWQFCCQRKPLFLVGVAENKRLRITITTDEPIPVDDTGHVEINLSGFQGKGCCS